MNLKEAYEELELNYYSDKKLSLTDIEEVYRNLVKKYHPDKNSDLPEYIKKLAEEKFKKINEAMIVVREELKNGGNNNTYIPKTDETKLEYYEKSNDPNLISYFRKNADLGYAEAQFYLGLRYYEGRGIAQDYTEAVRWYRKAAEQGYEWGQRNLGYCYENGKGVAQDYTEAVRWYKKAADQGHAVAQNNLGFCYEYGRGVEKDYAQAAYWYVKAIENGQERAREDLIVLLNEKLKK